jgi:hypothetical protein
MYHLCGIRLVGLEPFIAIVGFDHIVSFMLQDFS